jgi:uncharacterized protein (TIGR03435 family)
MSFVKVLAVPVAASLTVFGLLAQAPELQFEVASLKPSPPGEKGGGIRPAPGGTRYLATGVPLKLLLTVAYRIRDDQISGGPAWMGTDLFDMNAEAERPASMDELHVMLQNLIKERFKLRMHSETKERPVYFLSVDKTGVKTKPHEIGSAGDPWIDQPGFGRLTAKFTPMDYFAWRLSLMLDRPVLDRTGLKGGYDFDLSWTPDLPPGFPEGGLINGQAVDTSGPTIFAALEKQLGLKLEAQRGPFEILVIDHAEKPAGN